MPPTILPAEQLPAEVRNAHWWRGWSAPGADEIVAAVAHFTSLIGEPPQYVLVQPNSLLVGPLPTDDQFPPRAVRA